MPTVASATDDIEVVQCSARTLRGLYYFHASGYNIVNGVALPKAIIEKIVFDGRGNVLTPAVALSINGNHHPAAAGESRPLHGGCRLHRDP